MTSESFHLKTRKHARPVSNPIAKIVFKHTTLLGNFSDNDLGDNKRDNWSKYKIRQITATVKLSKTTSLKDQIGKLYIKKGVVVDPSGRKSLAKITYVYQSSMHDCRFP